MGTDSFPDSFGPGPDVHGAAGIASLLDDEACDEPRISNPLPLMDSPCSVGDRDLRAALAASTEDHSSEAHRRADMEDEALQLALQESQKDSAASVEDEEAMLSKILELSKVDQ